MRAGKTSFWHALCVGVLGHDNALGVAGRLAVSNYKPASYENMMGHADGIAVSDFGSVQGRTVLAVPSLKTPATSLGSPTVLSCPGHRERSPASGPGLTSGRLIEVSSANTPPEAPDAIWCPHADFV